MIQRNIVEPQSVDRLGNRMFPGQWIETWVLMSGTGIWILVDFKPLPPR